MEALLPGPPAEAHAGPILNYTVLYYTILYSRSLVRAAASWKLRDFNSASCKRYCIIISYIVSYYTTLYQGRVPPARPLERRVKGTAAPGKLQDYNFGRTILYYIILYGSV